MTRKDCLDAAEANVTGQRQHDYGVPEDNFGRIAGMWTGYKGVEFSPADVAAMMALVKIARLSRSPQHSDSWIDLAGYAACGAEVSGCE